MSLSIVGNNNKIHFIHDSESSVITSGNNEYTTQPEPEPQPEPDPEPYILYMADSYGDGWNGATWIATNNSTGEVLGPYTLNDGTGATQEFHAPDGEYTIVCGGGGGYYDSEVSWGLHKGQNTLENIPGLGAAILNISFPDLNIIKKDLLLSDVSNMLFYNENKDIFPIPLDAVGIPSAQENVDFPYGILLPKENMSIYYGKYITNVLFGVLDFPDLSINTCKVKIYRTNDVNDILSPEADLEQNIDPNTIIRSPPIPGAEININDIKLSSPLEIRDTLNTIIILELNISHPDEQGYIAPRNEKLDIAWNDPNVSNIYILNNIIYYYPDTEWSFAFQTSDTAEGKNPAPLVKNRKKLELNNKNTFNTGKISNLSLVKKNR